MPKKFFLALLFMNVSSNLAMHEVTFHLMANGEKSQKKTSFAYEKSCSSSFIHWKKKKTLQVCVLVSSIVLGNVKKRE